MKLKAVFLFLSINSIVIIPLNAYRSCYTPAFEAGECKDIQNCKSLLSIMNDPKRTRSDSIFFRDSACGTENKRLQVCCQAKSICTTPDLKRGTCVPLYECPSLFKLSKELDDRKEDFLVKSRCDQVAFGVCCGDNDFLVKGVKLPPRTDCGREAVKRRFLDVSDGRAEAGQYPWLVRIEFRSQVNGSEWPCLGALIGSRYVLTSAHCFADESYVPINVILGKHDLSKNVDCRKNDSIEICDDDSIIVPIEKIIPHSNFDKLTHHNNIALIRMANEITYSDLIKPICLPQMNLSEESENQSIELITSGWNTTSVGSKSAKKSQTKVSYLNHKSCKDIYNASSMILPLRSDWSEDLCTLGQNDRPTCWSEESVPLMKLKNDQLELVGFSLLKGSCVSNKLPDVYTNVYSYMEWIIENLED